MLRKGNLVLALTIALLAGTSGHALAAGGAGVLADPGAMEEEVGREWEWLHDVINRVARMRAEQGDTQMFRILQEQSRVVGQRRVELQIQMAALETISSLSKASERPQ